MVASLNLGFYKRKFAEGKRTRVINKRDLLFLSGKRNSNIGGVREICDVSWTNELGSDDIIYQT